MYRTIILATANRHKVDELRTMLADLPITIQSAAERGFVDEIEETEPTLEGNALLKATTVAKATGLPSLADDTGLEVDALHGAPGVYSARFAGAGCTPKDNRLLLLKKLSGVPYEGRTACFRSVLAFVEGDQARLFEGRVDGMIAESEKGERGFGYDALFIPEGETRTLAEMTAEEKNAVSHRGRAIGKLRAALMESR